MLPAECRFEEAVECLERCSPAAFQPSQLFPLFPTYTAPWAQQVRLFPAVADTMRRLDGMPAVLQCVVNPAV